MIIINGSESDVVAPGVSVLELLEALDVPDRGVAVAVDGPPGVEAALGRLVPGLVTIPAGRGAQARTLGVDVLVACPGRLLDFVRSHGQEVDEDRLEASDAKNSTA